MCVCVCAVTHIHYKSCLYHVFVSGTITMNTERTAERKYNNSRLFTCIYVAFIDGELREYVVNRVHNIAK
jgi:hypothetical protein